MQVLDRNGTDHDKNDGHQRLLTRTRPKGMFFLPYTSRLALVVQAL